MSIWFLSMHSHLHLQLQLQLQPWLGLLLVAVLVLGYTFRLDIMHALGRWWCAFEVRCVWGNTPTYPTVPQRTLPERFPRSPCLPLPQQSRPWHLAPPQQSIWNRKHWLKSLDSAKAQESTLTLLKLWCAHTPGRRIFFGWCCSAAPRSLSPHHGCGEHFIWKHAWTLIDHRCHRFQ